MNIVEALQREVKEPVRDLAVQIDKVGKKFPNNEGTPEEWFRRSLTVHDDSGSAEVSWRNETFEPKQGQRVTISARKTERGWFGASVGIFRDKKTINVSGDHVQLTGPYPAEQPQPTPDAGRRAASARGAGGPAVLRFDEALDVLALAFRTLTAALPNAGPSVVGPMASTVLIGVERGEIQRPPVREAGEDSDPFGPEEQS